ncbi:hypothetical protein SCHPADRAFT_932821 [Schizopora paradoxa]|uniref:Uncharacterized protein n=1 Tax=Schizopora paradoxa TaxID=27342 RepID=A0A0H2RBG7_9AGAM|nr:hypothetical protein SCHPADRAFT_932821 [Schizopora paradoxa]
MKPTLDGLMSESTRPIPADDYDDWETRYRVHLQERQKERFAELTKQAEEEFNQRKANAPGDRAYHERLHDSYLRSLARVRQMMKDEEDALVEKERQVRRWSIGDKEVDEESELEQLKREQHVLWGQLQGSGKRRSVREQNTLHLGRQSSSSIEIQPVKAKQQQSSQVTAPRSQYTDAHAPTQFRASRSHPSYEPSNQRPPPWIPDDFKLSPTPADNGDGDWEIEYRAELHERQRGRLSELCKQAEKDFSQRKVNLKAPDDRAYHERLHDSYLRSMARVRQIMRDDEDALVEKERQIRNLSTRMRGVVVEKEY